MIDTTKALPTEPLTTGTSQIFAGPVLYGLGLKIENIKDSYMSYLAFGDNQIAITHFEPNELKHLGFDMIKLSAVDTRPYVINKDAIVHLDMSTGERKQLGENQNNKKTSPYPIYIINSDVITAITPAEKIATTYPNLIIRTDVGYLEKYDGADKEKLREHIAIVQDQNVNAHCSDGGRMTWFFEDDYLLAISKDNNKHTTYFRANGNDVVLSGNELVMLKDYQQPNLRT